MSAFTRIEIYTDGAARGNPGPGGFGVVMKAGVHRKEYAEGYKRTTNNRMELLAVIRALELLQSDKYPVHIYSDSRYVVDTVQKGWLFGWVNKGFQGKKNKDLWMKFLPLYMKYKPTLHWVKGHANNVENNRCDELAVQASQGRLLLIDAGFEG
jgi:ribonuclease HI